MKRQFIATYQTTITLIKQLKNSNDTLNRSIGIDNIQSIYRKIELQQSIISNIIQRIEQQINNLEETYLDPDTARKIGTAKQQFRIQKDRRKQLIQTINYEQQTTKSYKNRHINKNQSQLTSSMITNDSSFINKNSFRNSQLNDQNKNMGVNQEQVNKEYEMQRKIMIQRNNQINNVTQSILKVQSIMNQTSQLVQQQGQKIDIIGEEMFTTYRNVHAARENLVQANQYQKKSRTKYVVVSMFLIIGIIIGAIVLVG